MAEQSLKDRLEQATREQIKANPETNMRFCSETGCNNYFHFNEVETGGFQKIAEENKPGTKYLCAVHSPNGKPTALIGGKWQASWAK